MIGILSEEWSGADGDMTGLKRVRDKLLSDLRALQKDRPRADDEARLSELSRLESALQVARDDLVRPLTFL